MYTEGLFTISQTSTISSPTP